MTGSIAYKIFIPLKRSDDSHTPQYKGRQLEELVAQFLKRQNYEVIDRYRDAGTEIDLLCRNRLTNELVVVECKAHERPLGSEVVNKLFADVTLKNAKFGWIFSTSELGAEARTRLEQMSSNSERQLRFFSGHELVQNLIDPGILTPPSLPTDVTVSSEIGLVLIGRRKFWAASILDALGQPRSLLCWDASTGASVGSDAAPNLEDSDLPSAALPWVNSGSTKNSEHPKKEDQAVVDVIPGDEWSDYRPSRPHDFVGRSALIGEISAFFSGIVTGQTATRIFGIKGRSGWGKSSLALKLADQLQPANVIVVPVDCRAARTPYYADLALTRAIRRAVKIFEGPLFEPVPDFRTNPFKEDGIRRSLENIKSNGGLVVVIFDQFEAIIHRTELKATFERLQQIALFADELRGGIAIGFSWKTDGTVGADNPGYHLWHSLADRRRDFEVDRFTREDAEEFIQLALRSAHTHLPKSVVEFIIEHHAGYPWLLKKLIKHCIDDVQITGNVANISTFFNVDNLFNNDLQELTPSELAAVKFIAKESPVEMHIAEDKCGSETISSLIDRRVIIKSGAHLSLYWDIFRDYVLNKHIPHIPSTYVPALSYRKLRSVVRFITSTDDELSYADLAKSLGVGFTTADNVVRDLSNMGLVIPDRPNGTFSTVPKDTAEATGTIVEFLRGHAVFLRTKQIVSDNGFATFKQISLLVESDYAFVSIDSDRLRGYVRKVLSLCIILGVLHRAGDKYTVGVPISDIVTTSAVPLGVMDDAVFRGAAPPQKVFELLLAIRDGHVSSLHDAKRMRLRNAVYAASSLKLVVNSHSRVGLTPLARAGSLERIIAERAEAAQPLKLVLETFADPKRRTAEELGLFVAENFNLNWSERSCRRYGSAIRDWCTWLADRRPKLA